MYSLIVDTTSMQFICGIHVNAMLAVDIQYWANVNPVLHSSHFEILHTHTLASLFFSF